MSKYDFINEPIAERKNDYAPTNDIRNVCFGRNFCSDSRARIINAIYEDVSFETVVWQPDVYFEARKLAEYHKIGTVIDIGCGNGEKLVHYFPNSTFDTKGVDFHGSLSMCRTTYPERQWIECDLTSNEDLARVSEEIGCGRPAIFILSDVLEHLVDPRPLVAWLRVLLLSHPLNRLVMSTPDRARLGYEVENDRPKNEAHVREWTLTEIEDFWISSGFEIVRSGHTRANQFDVDFSTIYVELSCSPEYYRRFLQETGLLYSDKWPQHLLITAEYAGFHNTGGIGTFVWEQRQAYETGEALCLFAGEVTSVDSERLREARLVHASKLLNASYLQALPIEDQLLVAVQQLLFFFPDLRSVQYADYQGLGCRIAQAKRAGMLPSALSVIVHCHGGTHYLENAHQSWFGASHFGVSEKEKISLENADLVTFPTGFLQSLYAESGICIPSGKTTLLRYPYTNPVPVIHDLAGIDTLIFYGKRTSMKGYDLFLHALTDETLDAWKSRGITRITLIGPRPHVSDSNDELLALLKQHFQVEELVGLDREQAMGAVYERAHRAICVMPYIADNHPYALLDVAFSTALPVMVRAGGVPELFPYEFRPKLLADPNSASVRDCILKILDTPIHLLRATRTAFVGAMVQVQQEINQQVKEFPGNLGAQRQFDIHGEATVIVPVFNTPLEYIADLAFGLNNQTYLPKEVIFIDDASEENYVEGLLKVLSETLRLAYRVVRHNVNKGLAAARNSGVAAANTEFVINIDSDDIPCSNFVRDIVRTLTANPEHVAAVPYLSAFDDGTEFNEFRTEGYVYRPLGDGVIASQLDNLLGHANAGFRTNALREFNGWDESTKSMWEDWALYLKFVSAGRKIAVIPNIGCLYRVRAQSMLRTYKVWPAMRRLASNMSGLPRYENFRLQAVMRCQRDLVAREAELTEHLHVLERELNRRSVRAARSISNRLVQYPALFSALRSVGRGAWRIARGLRQTAHGLRANIK